MNNEAAHTQVLIAHLRRTPLAHGYAVVEPNGAFAPLAAEITSFFRQISLRPDITLCDGALFGIEEARELRRKAYLTAADKKIFLIASAKLSPDAQNALLRVCEEPPEQTHIFVFVASSEKLLPTLRSRLVPITLPMTRDLTPEREAELLNFLRDTPAVRLRAVTKYATDRTWTVALLRDVEIFIVGRGLTRKNHEWAGALETIGHMRRALYRPAAASRMIAEYITVVLPLLIETNEA